MAQQKLPEFLVIKVTDVTGVVVPGAEVRVVPVGSGGASVLRTDSNGLAYLNAVTGRYELSVMFGGFRPQTRTVELLAGHAGSESFALNVAGGSSVELEPGSEQTISPSRPIPAGQAPGMQVKLVSNKGGEKVYAVIFRKGDEVFSGLVDFATQYKVQSAHFTGIGAVSGATVGWLDLDKKMYRQIDVTEQVEVLSMMGDVALFNGKPVVHAHLVMGRQDGSTVGGHLWEAHVNPTLEVFVSVDPVALQKKPDEASGMKLIDPKQ